MRTLTDTTFRTHLNEAEKPVLVDFWATWCPPCRMIEPVLREIEEEHKDILEVVKVDVDASPVTAAEEKVMGMPTLSLYQDGKLVYQIVGARPKQALLRELAPYLPQLTATH
ncbi:thioredoxin [Actinocrispum sp. NPDC049592]|uniref:thioredoxin n=1 Tax=Actinocrispum sp. NPDC049592 TaxID=3154835 RepID=UPI00343B4D82